MVLLLWTCALWYADVIFLYLLPLPRRLCYAQPLSVCLSVSNFTLKQTTERVLMKNFHDKCNCVQGSSTQHAILWCLVWLSTGLFSVRLVGRHNGQMPAVWWRPFVSGCVGSTQLRCRPAVWDSGGGTTSSPTTLTYAIWCCPTTSWWRAQACSCLSSTSGLWHSGL